MMEPRYDVSWREILEPEFEKPYFAELADFVDSEYSRHTCYPPKQQIFNAFLHCRFDDLKAVIIGQDPYHGPGQSHGLCFSVNDGVRFPPSLRNIFKEVAADTGNPVPDTGNLTRWAQQGVLLLNVTMTVRQGHPGSHQGKGWETFTDAVISEISSRKPRAVFFLWGAYAQRKSNMIDSQKHLILESCHPSPLSAIRQKWFGNRHFTRANEFLMQNQMEPVRW